YWYRVYYPIPGKQAEDFVGAAGDDQAQKAMQDRIAYAAWTVAQVKNLRKLNYQVADKGVASVLVELHNRKLFEAGLVVVGTLAYMCWLNEYGAMATKLPGREGLRVDLLAPGAMLGDTIQVPELEWHAQAIPHYGYMLDDSQKGAMLAGGHCIPIMLPRMERMIWHKLYASTQRTGAPDKAEKDIVQAVTLAAVLVDQDGASLTDSFRDAPTALRSAALSRLSRITPLLGAHPETLDAFRSLY
ncbi:MAG: hypothetical protein QOI88_4212, partial [Gammaproteobacteria bacterium]|nr:hypothetical protein [Gammaproteobacteria bacterium]